MTRSSMHATQSNIIRIQSSDFVTGRTKININKRTSTQSVKMKTMHSIFDISSSILHFFLYLITEWYKFNRKKKHRKCY